MRITRLAEPRPRPHELPYRNIDWAYRTIRPLSTPIDIDRVDFFEVLRGRATRRRFGPLEETRLSLLLWYVARDQRPAEEDSHSLWTHKFIPSAGGRHPIEMVVIPPISGRAIVYLYDALSHCLKELIVADKKVRDFHTSLQEIVPSGDGTILWLLADFDRTSAKYENAESLVWRDAGIVLGAIHMVAAALNINCCSYGINGDAWTAELTNAESVYGAGGCVVGSNPS